MRSPGRSSAATFGSSADREAIVIAAMNPAIVLVRDRDPRSAGVDLRDDALQRVALRIGRRRGPAAARRRPRRRVRPGTAALARAAAAGEASETRRRRARRRARTLVSRRLSYRSTAGISKVNEAQRLCQSASTPAAPATMWTALTSQTPWRGEASATRPVRVRARASASRRVRRRRQRRDERARERLALVEQAHRQLGAGARARTGSSPRRARASSRARGRRRPASPPAPANEQRLGAAREDLARRLLASRRAVRAPRRSPRGPPRVR